MRSNPVARATLVSLLAMLTVPSCNRGDPPADGAAGRRATVEPAGAATTPATSTAPAPAPAATSAPAGATAVRVRVVNSAAHGPILADGNGRALYLLESDGTGGGTSSCTEMCLVIWPAYLGAAGTPPTADSGVQARLLGTAARPGGGVQVSYAGHPLYYYLGDARPGDTRGQRVEDSWGEWYLVQPEGREASSGGGERGGRRGRGRGGDDR